MQVAKGLVLSVGAFVFAFLHTVSSMSQASTLRDQVLPAYRSAYQDLIKRYCSGRFRVRMEADAGPEALQVTELVGAMSENGFAFINRTSFVNRSSGEVIREVTPRVEGGNVRYDFTLRADTPGRYVLLSVDQAGRKGQRIFPVITTPYADWGAERTIQDILADPDTQFHEIQDTKFNGHNARALKVTVPGSERATRRVGPSTKTYFFSIQQGWICLGWRHEPEADGHYSEIVATYSDSGTALPELKRVDVKICNASQSAKDRVASKQEIVEFNQDESVDSRTFYLSHYGLPEPFGVEPPARPTPWWLYAGMAAGVLLLVISLLLILKRRMLTQSNSGR